MKSVGRFYCFHFFDQTPTLQILVYKLSAQVPKLTTLSIDFSIKLPTRWYITILVPSGVQRNDFSGISSNGLQGLSEPEFYGDLVYKFKKIEGRADFSDQFRKIIVRYKRIGYNINIMRQSAC